MIIIKIFVRNINLKRKKKFLPYVLKSNINTHFTIHEFVNQIKLYLQKSRDHGFEFWIERVALNLLHTKNPINNPNLNLTVAGPQQFKSDKKKMLTIQI